MSTFFAKGNIPLGMSIFNHYVTLTLNKNEVLHVSPMTYMQNLIILVRYNSYNLFFSSHRV